MKKISLTFALILAIMGISHSQISAPIVELTDEATVKWDWSTSPHGRLTLKGNRTLSISNADSGSYATIVVIQDGTGSRTLKLPNNGCHKVVNGKELNLSKHPNAIDVITTYFNGKIYYYTVGVNFY